MKMVIYISNIIICLLLLGIQNVVAQNYSENPIMKEYVETAKIKDKDKRYEKITSLVNRADSLTRRIILTSAAKISFETKHFEQARSFSLELLEIPKINPNDWFRGDAIHDGNMVLGRLAIVDNDIEKANEYLLSAGKTSGSPNLNSFGPNFSLANDLLKLGETEIVLEYFSLCRKFWKLGKEKLDIWEKEIKQGSIPKFGANLVY